MITTVLRLFIKLKISPGKGMVCGLKKAVSDCLPNVLFQLNWQKFVSRFC